MKADSRPAPEIFAAALTPFCDDLSVDHEAFASYCRWLLSRGCSGIAVMGTTGEAPSFSVEERMELLERLLEAELPPEKLLIGTGCCALPDTVRLTRHATARGVAGVLVLPPFYYKPVSDDGLFGYFGNLIQQVGDHKIRIVLYHFPKMAGVSFSFSLIDRLVREYAIAISGIKDSSGEIKHMLEICRRFPSLRVYSGTESCLLKLTMEGGAGCISASVNLTASLARAVIMERRTHKARHLQDQLTTIRHRLELNPFVPGLKALMARATDSPNWLRMRYPLVDLDTEAMNNIDGTLTFLRSYLTDI